MVTEFDKDKFRELIDRDGRTREWVCKELGMAKSTLAAILLGHRQPSLTTVKLMARIFEVTEETLIMESKGA